MSRDRPLLAAFPPWYDDPTFTIIELAAFAAAPEDTIYAWHRLAKAMDIPCGQKRARWLFSPREMFGFAILAAMYRLGMPISAPQIRAAFDFARRGTAGNFYQLSGDRIAHVCVQAPELYQQVLERCAADHLEVA